MSPPHGSCHCVCQVEFRRSSSTDFTRPKPYVDCGYAFCLGHMAAGCGGLPGPAAALLSFFGPRGSCWQDSGGSQLVPCAPRLLSSKQMPEMRHAAFHHCYGMAMGSVHCTSGAVVTEEGLVFGCCLPCGRGKHEESYARELQMYGGHYNALCVVGVVAGGGGQWAVDHRHGCTRFYRQGSRPSHSAEPAGACLCSVPAHEHDSMLRISARKSVRVHECPVLADVVLVLAGV